MCLKVVTSKAAKINKIIFFLHIAGIGATAAPLILIFIRQLSGIFGSRIDFRKSHFFRILATFVAK